MADETPYKAIVIGVSAGGLEALKTILSALPSLFAPPIIIVQHRNDSGSYLTRYLGEISALKVQEAEDKEPLHDGHVYLAPAGYHLLIEPDYSLSLSIDQRVNHARPSIDVLFESAADVFGKSLIGIVLTGANSDGAHGLKTIKEHGGMTIVQNPETSESTAMPKAALSATNVDHILNLKQIAPLLMQITQAKEEDYDTDG